MSTKRTKLIALAATLAFLAACGGSQMLPGSSLFGPTVKAAFAKSSTDEPLTSAQIQGLLTDRPLSLTADPIDL